MRAKSAAMAAHAEFVRRGDFVPASDILYFLRRGHITLGLGDEDRRTDCALEGAGFRPLYLRDGDLAEYDIRRTWKEAHIS